MSLGLFETCGMLSSQAHPTALMDALVGVVGAGRGEVPCMCTAFPTPEWTVIPGGFSSVVSFLHLSIKFLAALLLSGFQNYRPLNFHQDLQGFLLLFFVF